MIVFVCYWEDPHAGCGQPDAVFEDERLAREYCCQRGPDWTYVELVVG